VKKYGFVPAVCPALFSWAFACPVFTEFYPDPKDVSDQEGEYVEIRMDDFRAESLYVQFESKTVMAFAWPEAERFLLVHDSAKCTAGISCGLLGNVSLPNSRETVWKVWAGTCMDSVVVPHPKPGKVVQRVGLTDEWAFVDAATASSGTRHASDSLLDGVVAQMIAAGASPLRVTEVHHCPEEPMPEWVEVYNASEYPLPLDAFRFCDRGGVLGRVGDSIRPFQTVLVSKDTASLRDALGIPDIYVIQVSLGFLNNTEGFLRLCYNSSVLDSVFWNKNTVACPSGFNPITLRRDFSPGYLPRNVRVSGRMSANRESSDRFFEYKLSSRVVARKGAPLRIRVESEHDVVVALLDSAGRRVWKTVVSAMTYEWVKVPAQEYLGIGAGFVSLSVGEYEDVVGILVRP
jgi:hypothetical protein